MSEMTTLFWDVGGVVLSNGWDRDTREAACRRFGLEDQDFEKRHELAAEAFETGRMTLDGYLDATVFYQARPFSRGEFRAFLLAQSSQNDDTVAALGELAATRRYLLATLNNESAELNLHRIRTFRLTRYFTAFLSSCYLGARKPGEAIYRLALGITQRPAEQCIFIDDRPPNLEPARRLGMRTIHFQNPVQLRTELKDCGVRYD
jgi:putative hydrolase of the HAD superfamily